RENTIVLAVMAVSVSCHRTDSDQKDLPYRSRCLQYPFSIPSGVWPTPGGLWYSPDPSLGFLTDRGLFADHTVLQPVFCPNSISAAFHRQGHLGFPAAVSWSPHRLYLQRTCLILNFPDLPQAIGPDAGY